MPDPVYETKSSAGGRTRRAAKSAAEAQQNLNKAHEEADEANRLAQVEQQRFYRRQQAVMVSEWATSVPIETVVARFCAAMSITQLEEFTRQTYNPQFGQPMQAGMPGPPPWDARDRDE